MKRQQQLIAKYEEYLHNCKQLDPITTCKQDAKKLLDFVRHYLHVPTENITLMCSRKDFEDITDIRLWDDSNFKRFTSLRE
jgi:hypothetical protein